MCWSERILIESNCLGLSVWCSCATCDHDLETCKPFSILALQIRQQPNHSHSLATPQNKFAGPVRYPVASRALRAEWHLSEYIIQKYLRFVHTGHISYVISVSSCTAVCTAYPILIWRCFLSLIFFTRILTIKSSCATVCDPDHGRLRHSREGSFHSQWQRSCPRRKSFPKGSFNVAQRSHTH